MSSLDVMRYLFRRLAVAVANRSTRKIRRLVYKSRIDEIRQSAQDQAPDLAKSFSGHLFESGPSTLSLYREDVIEAAKKVERGSFVLFGEWFDIPKKAKEAKDQWCTDFLTNVQFAFDIYTDIVPKKDVADIKVPWEYGRMQYLLPLAAAYKMTRESHYLDEFRSKVEGFSLMNPLGKGVQWVCTMEVGIRVFNLLASYELLRGALSSDDALHVLVAEMAICHGEHIWANLETSAKLQENNHYIADLLGLAAIVSCYPNAPKSPKWGRYTKEELERCAKKQILNDGCCFERSTRYTRLVGEMLFFASKVLSRTTFALSEEYHDRVTLLGAFLDSVTDVQGRSLQLGDNDSGRAVCISPSFHDDLRLVGRLTARERGLDVGAAQFPEEELLYEAPTQECGAVAWDNDIKVFPDAGVALVRLWDWSLGFYACDGFRDGAEAGHTHNDKLSFTLAVDGVSFFVDPGSGVYTRKTQLRNKLRGTSQHSTLWFKGLEQNEFGGLFGFIRCGGATLDVKECDHEKAVLEGATDCWLSRVGVVHRRVTIVDSRQIQIIDFLDGEVLTCSAFRSFVLAPSVSIAALAEGRIDLHDGGVSVRLESNAPISMREGLFSAHYGSIEKTLILDIPYVSGEENTILIRRNENKG